MSAVSLELSEKRMLEDLRRGFSLKTFMGLTPAPRTLVVGGTWPRSSLAVFVLQGTLQRVPRPRFAE